MSFCNLIGQVSLEGQKILYQKACSYGRGGGARDEIHPVVSALGEFFICEELL